MRFSLSVTSGSVSGSGMPPDAAILARLAARAEELGFHALYFTDHFLYSGATMHSGPALAVAASATSNIRLGFAAYVLPLRHPVAAAKELATLDALTGGRLIAGLAAGSHAPEFEAFGIPFGERGARFDEALQAMMALWTQREVRHHGRFWAFDDVTLVPNVVQRPHPPIWIGSWTASPRAARLVARHAAGWQASGLHTSIDEVRAGWSAIERSCQSEGRDPATIGRAYVNAITRLDTDRERAWSRVGAALREREDLRIIGTPADAVAKIRALGDAGIEEVSLILQPPIFEQLDLVALEVMPAFAAGSSSGR